MIGGLFKSSSRLALVAAAGVLVGGVSAQAADLGGDCCADLEERVAELEATTARKGNRKVSLTISGQIHESIMFWDDGVEKGTYVGVNHINSSSRFRFTGDAKINPTWSAGYLMEIETQAKSDSNDVNQHDQNNGSGTGVVVRHNAWWIDNKQLGRVWVGLTDAAGTGIDGINLSNSNIAANQKIGLTNSSFFLRQANGLLSGRTWGNSGTAGTANSILGGNNGLVNLSDETRQNVVKYVSPTMAGFILSAAVGEDQMWDVALRYAGEFSGFKLALGATYTQVTDSNGTQGGVATTTSNHFDGCAITGTLAGVRDRDCTSWVVGGSLMHVATGLFVAGSYGERQDNNRVARLLFTTGAGANDTDLFWQARGGIEQNFFGIGKTTLFGEYNRFEGTTLQEGDLGPAVAIGSEVSVWGLGVVQTIDAAAMDLYLTYRNYSADLSSAVGTHAPLAAPLQPQDFTVITFGGRIQF